MLWLACIPIYLAFVFIMSCFAKLFGKKTNTDTDESFSTSWGTRKVNVQPPSKEEVPLQAEHDKNS